MRRILLMIIVLTAFTSLYAEDNYDKPFKVYNPILLGKGDTSVATAHGYVSLFTNPAGFSREGGDVTFISASIGTWGNPKDLKRVIDYMTDSNSDDLLDNDEFVSIMNSLLLDTGVGLNGNGSAIGIVGKGLGLGFFQSTDIYASGESLLGVEVELISDTSFVAGLSHKFDFSGFPIHLGGDIRPVYRIKTNPLLKNVISNKSSDDNSTSLDETIVYQGFGLGIDAGLIAEINEFTIGFSIRDLFGTRMYYSKETISEVFDKGASNLDSSEGRNAQASTPMTIALGASYHPDLRMRKKYIDPSFSAEYRHEISTEKEKSFLTQTHFGTELTLFKYFTLRAGLNGGDVSLGGGVHFAVFDINLVGFSEELGNYAAQADKRTGYMIEIALRI
ncbi:conjugal transfer protein TraF [Spirochaeta cellobiosiphila]|uniref:conjugal transfer protein TraF n=1 Tax=Spirochaeta cellobiosiphila TaxID=504483 RepID=UPI0004234F94|nr:conjugal transfer protein TraF [Spirochaeta cellobiosiphila]